MHFKLLTTPVTDAAVRSIGWHTIYFYHWHVVDGPSGTTGHCRSTEEAAKVAVSQIVEADPTLRLAQATLSDLRDAIASGDCSFIVPELIAAFRARLENTAN